MKSIAELKRISSREVNLGKKMEARGALASQTTPRESFGEFFFVEQCPTWSKVVTDAGFR
jgi:hypothetical protein